MATISMIYKALNENYFLHFAGFKFLGMRFLAGANWNANDGFTPNIPVLISIMKANLESNNLVMIDDL